MPQNRLSGEASPYLLQHADQPVDWHPWGEEALRLAGELDRPVFLSIGYAACHWCHVMAHESFEDPTVAAFLNANFVSIKVDREERPDLDHLYMQAVIAMNGHGGWPMSVFLKHDGRPFYGGTYFPPDPRHGLPGFLQLLEGLSDAWRTRRDQIEEVSGLLLASLEQARLPEIQAESLDAELVSRAVTAFGRGFDPVHGGFGAAPKFPPSMALEFLLREHARTGNPTALEMVRTTLTRMAGGGLFDQLGGGFCRYSTDAVWLVPHFEKMLTDNALLARVTMHAHLATGDAAFRRVCERTLEFILRELGHAGGGFAGSLDADSEGTEGRYYVWSHEEVCRVLGEDSELGCAALGVSQEGNWEGTNVLHAARSNAELAAQFGLATDEVEARMEHVRERLLQARGLRERPGQDHKMITAWNGLALAALAESGACLGRPDFIDAAVRCARFLHRKLRREDGRLMRTCSPGGEVRHGAFLEDYAYLADGLLALYRATFDEAWFLWARELAGLMLAHFSDADGGGFFDTADDHERLLVRLREVQDQAAPNAAAMAACVLLQVGALTGDPQFTEAARAALEPVSGFLARHPQGFSQWLCAVEQWISPLEVSIAGDPDDPRTNQLIGPTRSRLFPALTIAAGRSAGAVSLLANKPMIDGKPTAYVCRGFTCLPPVTDPGDLERLLSPGGLS